MTHPLSEKITAKLNGSDPHARPTITNAEAVEIRKWLDYAHGTLDVIRRQAIDGRLYDENEGDFAERLMLIEGAAKRAAANGMEATR